MNVDCEIESFLQSRLRTTDTSSSLVYALLEVSFSWNPLARRISVERFDPPRFCSSLSLGPTALTFITLRTARNIPFKLDYAIAANPLALSRSKTRFIKDSSLKLTNSTTELSGELRIGLYATDSGMHGLPVLVQRLII